METEKLHQRDALRSTLKSRLLATATISAEDVGKIFVVSPNKTTGRLMSHEEFLALSLDEIGEWDVISEFDVPI